MHIYSNTSKLCWNLNLNIWANYQNASNLDMLNQSINKEIKKEIFLFLFKINKRVFFNKSVHN